MSSQPCSLKSPSLPENALNRTNSNSSPAAQARNDPAPSPRPLSTRQLNAISLILAGNSDTEVATAIGIRRETVCDWRNHHPTFIARLNRERQQRHAATADRYDRLLNNYMDLLEQISSFDNPAWADDQIRIATSLLRSASRRSLTHLASPINPAEILQSLLDQGLTPSPDDTDPTSPPSPSHPPH